MRSLIVSILTRYKNPLILIVLTQLGCGLLVAVQPRYFQQLVSLAIGGPHVDLWAKGLPLLAWLAGVYVGIALLQGLGGYAGTLFSTRLMEQLQITFFLKTSRLPLAHFQQQSAGELFTSFANDIGQAQHFFAAVLPGVAREVITTITVTGILFYFCPTSLTIVAVCIVIFIGLLVTLLNRIMRRHARAQRAGWGKIHHAFDETIQGIDTLKTLAAEKERSADFQRQTGALRDLSARAGRILAVFTPGIELLVALGGLGLIALSYSLIAKGSLQKDPFLVFFFYATLLQMSVSHIAGSLSTLQTELTGMRRLASFLDETNEPEERHLTGKVPLHPVTLEFSKISFAYPGGRRLYYRAGMIVPAGSVTVLHGRSGSGKSTLINLLLRFYTPSEGTIFLDGRDIRLIPRTELRKKIGVVTQHHFIFQETLRANLLVARPDAKDTSILQALERAQLTDFLNRLPQGIDTVLDSRGLGMSAGEKQRLCIARLLLRESPIMILDEPWSNLDIHARELLAQVLNFARQTSTILVLSHERPQTLAVDRIYYLDEEKGIFSC